jgi:predicted PurR-regulated permease PerM
MTPEIREALSLLYTSQAITTLLTLVNSIVVLILLLRRKIPLDKELADYVKHAVCEKRENRMRERVDTMESAITRRLSAGDNLFRNIERSLGRIEGKIEDMLKR